MYGVEAGRRALLEEISGVFRAYGIGVDMRHLSLICDSMMYAGEGGPRRLTQGRAKLWQCCGGLACWR